MDLTLTVLDTAGIQRYIFGSNVLRENVGASELVYQATRLWAFEELDDLLQGSHNIKMKEAEEDVAAPFNTAFQIDKSNGEPAAEVIYAGGGNTVILFGGPDHCKLARDFVYQLSRRLLIDAPGLDLYAAHQPYTWRGRPSLAQVVDDTLAELARLKKRLPGSLPMLGLSVTADCTSTGLPANGPHCDPDKIGLANRGSRQVKCKWEAATLATNRLRKKFPIVGNNDFHWTDELDKIGAAPTRIQRSNESDQLDQQVTADESYIAIVHADGNGMGRRIIDYTESFRHDPDDPRRYITAIREFSQALQEKPTEALKRTVESLTRELVRWETDDGLKIFVTDETKIDEFTGNKKRHFPLRPIVFGGDDVTLVCAGPLGVTVAHQYLREMERSDEKMELPDGDFAYACAGVAIVKTHYPFSQAYDLSEQLVRSAKERVKLVVEDKRAAAIDWHFSTTGLTGDLKGIREREYRVQAGSLLARPLLLRSGKGGVDYGWRNWSTFVWLCKQQFGEEWWEKRNKAMALRETLRGGPESVNQFDQIYDAKLPQLGVGHGLKLDGGWVLSALSDNEWSKLSLPEQRSHQELVDRCLYFDAVEVADHFVFLPAAEAPMP